MRIAKTASGILNSVGLQNPGVDEFLRTAWPRIKDIDTVKIANIAGACVEDYIYVAERPERHGNRSFWVNVSCPNVKHGGVNFGTDERTLRRVVEEVKKISKKPLIVKLTPNVTHIAVHGKGGCGWRRGCTVLINTITGMAVNAATRKPVLANVTGGLSGRQ